MKLLFEEAHHKGFTGIDARENHSQEKSTV